MHLGAPRMKSGSSSIIATGFALMLLLLLLIMATGISNMAANNARMDRVVRGYNVKTNQINTLRTIARERSLLIYHMLLDRDPFVVDEEIVQLSLLASQFMKIRDEFFASGLSQAEKAQFDQMLDVVYQSTRVQQQVIDLLKEERFDEAGDLLQSKSLAEQDKALEQYDHMLDTQRGLAEKAAHEAETAYQRSLAFMLALSGTVIVLGVGVSAYTVRKTRRAEQALLELNNELEQRVEDRTQALSETNQTLQGTIKTLRNTQDQLIQAEKMASLGNLVAGISHEINTPLGIGVTSATNLQEELGLIQKQFESGSMKRSDLESFFSHANQAGDILIANMTRAASLVRSFKQVAVDQSCDDWREIDFRAYFDEILTSLRPKFKHTQIRVENHADADLRCHTHPGSIYQIISNLVLNALTHAYDAGQPGVIQLDAFRDGEDVVMTCRDNGRGVDAQHLGHLFEPFYTTRRGAGGTGLGLNIVYNLVTTQLGGQIEVASQTGKETVFTVRFPVAQGDGKA